MGKEKHVETARFDGIVICAGVASRHLAAMLGDRINVYPVKGYFITVELNDEANRQAAPWVSLVDDKAKIDTSRVIPWTGLRPMMPDMMPRVGSGKKPRVFYNTGHGHLGWTLSAATAQIIADQVSLGMPV